MTTINYKFSLKLHVYIVMFFVSLLNIIPIKGLGQISGKVLNIENNKPIEGVNIIEKKLNIGNITDKNGHFKIDINNANNDIALYFSHISFQTDSFLLFKNNKNNNLTIYLKPNIFNLKETVISSSLKSKHIDNHSSTIDYIFIHDNILILNYDMYEKKYKILLLKNFKDTIIKENLPKSFRPKNLYIDCLENSHLICNDTAYQIKIDSLKISFPFKVDIEHFNKTILDCICEIDDYLIFKKNNNEYLHEYYSISKTNGEYKNLITLDERYKEREFKKYISWLIKNRLLNGNISARIRFEKTIMYNPSYFFISKIGNKIFLFNHESGFIEIYSEKLILIKKIPIEYYKNKNWKEEIIFDKETNKVYTTLSNDGKINLSEINLLNGKLCHNIIIPIMFPYNIKINNGYLYFIHHDFNDENTKNKLYRMNLN